MTGRACRSPRRRSYIRGQPGRDIFRGQTKGRVDVLDDVDGAAAVVLDDLVAGVVSTAADNPGMVAGLVVLLRVCQVV